MPESTPLVQFPELSSTALVLVLFLFFGLLILAIGLDLRRRITAQKRRVLAEWRAAKEILADRELSDEELELVEDIVLRFASRAPLRAITVRHEFDVCVEKAMENAFEHESTRAFEALGLKLRDIRSQLSLDYVPFGQEIVSTRELHAGQWVSVADPSKEAPDWSRMMIERIDESYLYAGPKEPNKKTPLRLSAGDQVRVRLWRDEDARYLFTTTLASVDDAPPMWRMYHTNDLSRMQARNYFRIRHDQPTTIGILNSPVDGTEVNLAKRRPVAKLRGRITSLSAGGCALVVQQEVSKQVMLRLTLELSDKDEIDLEAKIIATSSISGGRFLLRVAFTGLDDERRDEVAKYVLHRQQHSISTRDSAP